MMMVVVAVNSFSTLFLPPSHGFIGKREEKGRKFAN